MNKEDREFLHDMANKLSKIDGFLYMLKMVLGNDNDKIIKMEKANSEALELLAKYRTRLESADVK